MKIKNILLNLICLFAMYGCVDLEREVSTNLQENQVAESFSYTQNRIDAVYEGLPSGFNPIGDAMLASATDDAEFTQEASSIQKFNTGNWNEVSNPDDRWHSLYQAIYRANKFLETSDNVNLDVYRLDPAPSAQTVYVNSLLQIERWKSEAIFLMAYFYFELVKRYGGVPLLTSTYEASDEYEN